MNISTTAYWPPGGMVTVIVCFLFAVLVHDPTTPEATVAFPPGGTCGTE